MSCALKRKRVTPLMDNPADLCRECDIALRVIALEELAKRLLDTIAKMQEENRDMQRDIKTLRSMTWC